MVLRPPQSHGRASRSDASAVVAVSVYKAVNKVAPSKGGSRPRHFRDKVTTCSNAPRRTSPWAAPRTSAAPTTAQPGRWAGVAEVGRQPTVTSPLERSGRLSPYHQSGNPCSSFAWRRFVECFIHGSGNCDAGVTARKRAWDSAEGAEPMCALSAETELASWGRNPARLGASPSLLARLGDPGLLDRLGEPGP